MLGYRDKYETTYTNNAKDNFRVVIGQKFAGDKTPDQYATDFQKRVLADNGTFVAFNCLEDSLNEIDFLIARPIGAFKDRVISDRFDLRAFINRVETDGGTYEANQCLRDILSSLGDATFEATECLNDILIEIGYVDPKAKELFSGYADLSYKDVDGILEPIRGAQLDISIDSSISRSFDVFLNFREKDFAAELYRNDVMLFQGFINAEGVTQPFTNKYWNTQLTAVDNLAALSNTELKYDNQLPSEFVLMDLCLKETGLNLPIAFFDDINFRSENESGVSRFYGKLLANGEDERIVDPLVFKNNNGRFVSCKKVLQDILNKYNAVLIQQSITHEGGTDLCWVFYRPAILYKSYEAISNPQFPVKQITSYTTQTDFHGYVSIDVPNITELGRANPVTLNVGIYDNPVSNSYYRNENQLIRQSRALQNFRFIQNWIQRNDWLDYDYNRLFIIDNFFSQNDYVINFLNKLLLRSTSFLASQIGNFTFTPSSSFGNQLEELIQFPEQTLEFEINGKAKLVNTFGSSLPERSKSLLCAVYHIVETGNEQGVYVARPTYEDNTPVYDPEKITEINWVKISSNPADGLSNPTDYNDLLFLFYRNQFFDNSAEFNFNLTLPPFLQQGGSINLFIGQLHETNESGGDVLEKTYECVIEDLKVNVIPPARLGQGEFHDALNQQSVSTKLDEPLEVINADETTNFFRNGLRYLPGSNQIPINYDLWTTDYDKTGDIRLLEIMSKERIRLFSKSQNIFSGDIGNYVPYFCRINNQAYLNYFFTFTKYIYRTAENTIEAEMREVGIGNPSVKYENSIIFEDEENRLIE